MFHLTYELKDAQVGVNVLSKYYGIRRMKIVVDGRRVGRGSNACYEHYVAYFKKRGLNKRTVLHEFYHHLAYVFEWDMTLVYSMLFRTATTGYVIRMTAMSLRMNIPSTTLGLFCTCETTTRLTPMTLST